MKVKVLQAPHPALRTVCAPVTEFGKPVQDIVDRLSAAIAQFNAEPDNQAIGKRGAGLAANQIGEIVRIVLIEYGAPLAMVNPVLVHRSSSEQNVKDACLSVENATRTATTLRAAECVVEYFTVDGKRAITRAKGLRAAIIQHELDHLEGKLFTDLLKRNKQVPRETLSTERQPT